MSTPRMNNPAQVLPDSMAAIGGLIKSIRKAGVEDATLELIHLRVSQINGCGPCLDASAKAAQKAGVSDERIFSVGAWRETPFYDEAERAALALAEHVTRLADREDAVPDDVWNDAAKHYDEQKLAALVLQIGVVNLFNRLNASTKQQAGQAW
ncbi:carboxymuconolactone decarboxylase family protein [Streptomyces melanogenes]|uniref:Carboxymuconolactone decarboxylase family protein n=1 Tax=Streptomyces melanogenes TaxID=67326 RepID=A0ABZ1XRE6_9ACTN|nr:carboxymuconolactone decarboxylase family protein [Streptomyces melanogenes]